MGSAKNFRVTLVAGLLGVIAMYAFSEPIAEWLAARISRREPPRPVVGKVLVEKGEAKRVHGGYVDLLPASDTPAPLHDGDRIESHGDSRVILLLASQDELVLKPLSSVSVQLWSRQDPASPVYLQVLAGDMDAKISGVLGKLYIVRDGRLYLPSQKPSGKPLALTVSKTDLKLPEADLSSTPEFESDPTGEDSTPSTEPRPAGLEPETLSNEYIEEIIASRQSQLQKCWFGRLSERPNLKGQVTIQLEIQRRGKVARAQIADSSLQDEVLHRCILTVMERLSFRSFRGPEISIAYPITFE